jgi:hypothetical protein
VLQRQRIEAAASAGHTNICIGADTFLVQVIEGEDLVLIVTQFMRDRSWYEIAYT